MTWINKLMSFAETSLGIIFGVSMIEYLGILTLGIADYIGKDFVNLIIVFFTILAILKIPFAIYDFYYKENLKKIKRQFMKDDITRTFDKEDYDKILNDKEVSNVTHEKFYNTKAKE